LYKDIYLEPKTYYDAEHQIFLT